MEWLKLPLGDWLALTARKQKELSADDYEAWLTRVEKGEIRVRKVPILYRTEPA